MKKYDIAILALTLWLIIVSVSMFLAQSVDITEFFVISLLGFLMIMMQIQPCYIEPNYQKYIWYLITAGLVIFCLIVVQNILDILGLEIVFP